MLFLKTDLGFKKDSLFRIKLFELHIGFYIQSFSLTQCIVIVRVGKYLVVCLSVCVSVCVCVCLSVCVSVFLLALDSQNYWADFNETFQK